jgi:hypothetical protein
VATADIYVQLTATAEDFERAKSIIVLVPRKSIEIAGFLVSGLMNIRLPNA